MKPKDTILITGGAGFIGLNLCKKFLDLDMKVIVFDNLSTGKIKNITEFIPIKNFKFIKGDANSFKDIKKIFDNYKIDYVFHYAAMVGVERTLKNPLGVFEDIDGIKYILELSQKHKIKKVVYSSSSEVYGEPTEIPEKEDSTPLNARLPYANVKAIGENYLKAYFNTYHLPTVSLRFFNVYGPKQSKDFVVSKFIRQAILQKPLIIFGNGKQTRDFVFIEDNIKASVKTLYTNKVDGHAINIGTGKAISIKNLAEKIIKITGSKSKITFLPPRKEGDMERRCPDITKMKKKLNYIPKHSIDNGLKVTYNWFKNL